MSTTDFPFSKALPEEVGIPSSAILTMLKNLDAHQVPMHSLLIMRHDKLVFEGYYAPYKVDTLHRMFSICKSMNAIAIGLLIEDGLIQIDDPIVKYFPDMVPENVHPWIKAMTIRDMLMMRSCHALTTYKYDANMEWVKSFFVIPPTHKPGTVFHYDTSAAHVLCVLVERLTGQKMLDFLKDRVLREIGWSETSYVIPNQFGDSQGGSGLMATSRDLLLTIKLLAKEGCWNGKQLLPRDYVKAMTSPLTANTVTSSVLSEKQGYGYQVWTNQHGGFQLYGMGGQLAIYYPVQDMLIVTTADTQGIGGGNDLIYNAIYDDIFPRLDEPAKEARQLLEGYAMSLHIAPLAEYTRASTIYPTYINNPISTRISGKRFIFSDTSPFFVSGILNLNEKEGALILETRDKVSYTLPFASDHCKSAMFPGYNLNCATSGTWLDENTFYIKSHMIDTVIGSVHFELYFGENDVTIFLKKVEESIFSEFNGHLYGTLQD